MRNAFQTTLKEQLIVPILSVSLVARLYVGCCRGTQSFLIYAFKLKLINFEFSSTIDFYLSFLLNIQTCYQRTDGTRQIQKLLPYDADMIWDRCTRQTHSSLSLHLLGSTGRNLHKNISNLNNFLIFYFVLERKINFCMFLTPSMAISNL